MSKTLVIVESPTKARTIRKFLGKEYEVESCMGHVRDLPKSARDIPENLKKHAWSKLGVNVDKKFDPIYLVPKTKTKVVRELKAKMKDADQLILATDEDREGESISWHLLEVLKPKIPVKRMVFHEITKKAIQEALEDVRDIDYNMVHAQEARRILDRLVGYTLSPLIWKKVAYGLSAGRVQSVAVRLISEREHERIKFKEAIYHSLTGECEKDKIVFDSKIYSYKGKRVASGKDFDADTGKLLDAKVATALHIDEKMAGQLLGELKDEKWTVTEAEEKPVSRKPSAPFITSTLQQEANRKLGLSARETMQVAQKLYEQGYITYMRTDSSFLSKQAIEASRAQIVDLYGKKYLPEEPRAYNKKKVKGAQEAHEAIRPAGEEFQIPDNTKLKAMQKELYTLIWKRTMASQMVNSQQLQMTVKFKVGEAVFSSSGMSIAFPGYLAAYQDSEGASKNKEVKLPKLSVGDDIKCEQVKSHEHATKPPARFNEASLVQKLEKEGIGRPSTYASIIGTIQDRGYVKKSGNALGPTFTALVVAKLLMQYLPDYVDPGFTSNMESQLDDIADGELDYIDYLTSFYHGDTGIKETVLQSEEKIDDDTSRSIELHGFEGLSFRVGRYGAYVCRIDTETGEEVCASLPETSFPSDLKPQDAHKFIDQKIKGADSLGEDPETGLPVFVLTGRYGPYVQLGDSGAEKTKPKRASIPPGYDPENLSFEDALQLLSLPKTLGQHPGTEKDIKVGQGRFGPYVVHDGDFRSIPKTESLFDVTFERAMELLSAPKKTRGRAAALKELGKHPALDENIGVYNGKYGPYVKVGKLNASVPDDIEPEKVTLEQAIEWLASKVEKVTKKKKKKTKKKATKKKTAKKKATKKKATKKKVAKKKRKAAKKS